MTAHQRQEALERHRGGTGRVEVERFYSKHFVGHWPDDVEVKSISRTVGQNRVIDELIVSFTHDREMCVFLPGVAPTDRKVVLPHVVVMGFDDAGRVAYEHIYWDQASLLVQVGLLDPKLIPVSGADRARNSQHLPDRFTKPMFKSPNAAATPAPAQPQGYHGLIEVADVLMRVNVPAANTLRS